MILDLNHALPKVLAFLNKWMLAGQKLIEDNSWGPDIDFRSGNLLWIDP